MYRGTCLCLKRGKFFFVQERLSSLAGEPFFVLGLLLKEADCVKRLQTS